MSIGKIIKVARIKKGLEQSELAEKIGVTGAAISNWEQDKKFPGGEALIKMIRELDILHEIFPESKNKLTLEKLDKQVKKIKAKLDLLIDVVCQHIAPEALRGHSIGDNITIAEFEKNRGGRREV